MNNEQFNENYKPFSHRLPIFLKDYPPSDYLFTVEHTDALSCNTALISLYEMAISNGLSPRDIGLPAIPRSNTFIFTAKLYKRENSEFIQSASSLRECLSLKDFEIGETTARQRLIAIMGYGGDQEFDSDELSDQLAVRNANHASQSIPNHQAKVEVKPYTKPHQDQVNDSDTPPDTDDSVDQQVAVSVHSDDSDHNVSDKSTLDPTLKRIIKQLELKSSVAGVDLDQSRLVDVKSAKQYLRDFNQIHA